MLNIMIMIIIISVEDHLVKYSKLINLEKNKNKRSMFWRDL